MGIDLYLIIDSSLPRSFPPSLSLLPSLPPFISSTQEQLTLVFSSTTLSLSSFLPAEVFTIINTLVHLNTQVVCVCVCVCVWYVYVFSTTAAAYLPSWRHSSYQCMSSVVFVHNTHTHTHTHTQHDDKNIEDHLTSVQQLALTITIDKVS